MQPILINGEWVAARSSVARQIINPATLALLTSVANCGEEDIALGVQAAQRALVSWARLPRAKRIELLSAIAADIRRRAVALAALLGRENGQPRCEAADGIEEMICRFERAGVARQDAAADQVAVVDALPINSDEGTGVVALLAGASDPLRALSLILVAALVAGRTVVYRPPSECPLSSLVLAECFQGLPPGVVNVITGDADTAKVLIAHPDVGEVAYAGATAEGQELAALAAGQGKPLRQVALKAHASIVCADADLELAVPAICWQWLHHSGQSGVPGRRLYVAQALAAAFAERIHEYAAFLEVGDPARADTDLGPLISLKVLREIESQVAHATKAGARLKLGGRQFQPWGLKGHFFQPTLLTGVQDSSLAWCEQIDGPVIAITAFEDLAPICLDVCSARSALDLGLHTADSEPVQAVMASLGDQARFVHLTHITQRDPRWFPYRDRAAGPV